MRLEQVRGHLDVSSDHSLTGLVKFSNYQFEVTPELAALLMTKGSLSQPGPDALFRNFQHGCITPFRYVIADC